MKVDKKELNKTEVEFNIEVEVQEMESFLKKTAQRLSEQTKIAGFRPGKAPYEEVKKHLGEMTIYESALDDIVSHYYWQIIEESKLEAIGQPKIEIVKFAPGNNFIFKATVALLPKVKLGKYIDQKIKIQSIKVDQVEVDKLIDNLLEMRAKESAKLSAVAKGDKVEIDFKISLVGQPIENGQAEKYPLIIGSDRMISGFEDQIVGLTVGQDKKFKLNFPDSYHDKKVAGQDCDFEIKLINAYKRELPELNEEFIKGLGEFKDVADFKNKIKDNVKNEKTLKEAQRAEIEMLDKIVANTEFEPIPEPLVDAEAHKMIHELQYSIESQGMVWDNYLQSIKKDHESLEKDFTEGAERRVKTSLVLRQIAEQEGLRVTKEEVKAQLKKLSEQFKDNPQAQENLQSEGYQKYLESSLNNEKVLEFLRSKNIVQ